MKVSQRHYEKAATWKLNHFGGPNLTESTRWALGWCFRFLLCGIIAAVSLHVATLFADPTVTHKIEGDATLTIDPQPVTINGTVGGEVKVTPGPVVVEQK